MTSITSTTTTTTIPRQDQLPEDQQSLVFQNNFRDLNVLLSIRGDVSVEEQEEIDAIELWSLLNEGEKNRVSYLLNTEKKWIVIDWVTGHFDDNRLGFTEQKGTGKMIPNIIRQQLMKQQYGVKLESSDNNNNINASDRKYLDFKGEDTELDLPQITIKRFIKGELYYDLETKTKKNVSGKEFFEALVEVFEYHYRSEQNSDKDKKLYFELIKCFTQPNQYVNLNDAEKVTPEKDANVFVGIRLIFTDSSKVVKEMLIFQRNTSKGPGNWSIIIRHNLGLNYDKNVLNLYFVIMDKQHYKNNNKKIKDALDTCYEDKGKLNNKLIKLVSGNLVESKKLTKEIKKIIDEEGIDEQQVETNNFKTSFNRHQLRLEVLNKLKNNKSVLNKKRSKEGNTKKRSKKTKKRKQGDGNLGATAEDPIDLTLIKIKLKF
ncbi:MAG: hypothetical protein CMO44_17050 [Verrucomicrobiales bacterium]|nr:hypothetical protein [Verrucomicrobiales bacterium]